MRRKGRLIAAMVTAFVVLPLALGLLFVFQKNGFGQHSGDGEQVKEASTEAADAIEETPEDEPVTITISATGDCTFAPTQTHGYAGSFHEYYDRYGERYFMDGVRDIFAQDSFTLVNLECALTDVTTYQEKEYVLVGKPSYAGILSSGAIEGVSLANNHSLDAGTQGLADTKAAVTGAGVTYAYYDEVGVYETPEHIRIGYVSSSLLSQGADREAYLQNGLTQLREMGVDLIIAACHWGEERTYEPTEYQKRMAHKCIDWGADLVIGNHPHVIQGIEEYQGKIICYSLGNFCFGGNSNPSDKRTFIYQQRFTFVDGQLQPDIDAGIIPCRVSSVSGYNDYQPTILTGEDKISVIEAVRQYSQPISSVTLDDDGNLLVPVTCQ